MADALFDLPSSAVVVVFTPTPKLSPDRRRTLRQAERLARGWHPLSAVVPRLKLHPQAAPHDDRDAPGRRCGNCWYRQLIDAGNRTVAKCFVDLDNPTDTDPRPFSLRLSHSAATDLRSWWPACVDHTYGDMRVSSDAARWTPGGGE